MPLELTTPRGEKIDVIVNYPSMATSGKAFPAIILAPGQGSRMDIPLLKGIAEGAAKNGVSAFRFNWHYVRENGQPSQDRSNEIEDMKTVIDYAKKDPRIDGSRILIAGKSLGSIVCYANFLKNPGVSGMFLLTPVFANDRYMEVLYPKLAEVTVPVLILLGNGDPYAKFDVMYKHLQTAGNNIAVVALPGDHGLNVGPIGNPDHSRENAENVDMAVQIVLHWLKTVF